MKVNMPDSYEIPNNLQSLKLKRTLKVLEVECAVMYDNGVNICEGKVDIVKFYFYGYQRYIPKDRIASWIRKQYRMSDMQIVKVLSTRMLSRKYEIDMSKFLMWAELKSEEEIVEED